MVEQTTSGCELQLRSQHPCGFDYLARLRYQLQDNALHATLQLTHCGAVPMLYGLGFTGRKGNSICRKGGSRNCLMPPISVTRNMDATNG
ncbi:hypothetical protein GM30_03725 [Trabulsiella odontotermitis]|nr:hypothetical protein GM30_03725 [Trabulsiella odontotermitis]